MIHQLTTDNPVVAMLVVAANEAERHTFNSYEDHFREVFTTLQKAMAQTVDAQWLHN